MFKYSNCAQVIENKMGLAELPAEMLWKLSHLALGINL